MACACGSSGRKSFSQIVASDGGSLPTLKYLHCKYKEQFEYQFSKIGVRANEETLKILASVHDSGQDMKGAITDGNGKPIYFSVADVVAKIDKSQPSKSFCSI